MTKPEIIKKLNDNGIFQLRKGESIQDALDYVDGKLSGSRKGYDIKSDDGTLLSKSEIMARSNKEAFSKYVTTPEYLESGNELSDYSNKEIENLEDCRENKNHIGIIKPCDYCGTDLRADVNENWEIFNCDSCMSYAILKNCM